MCVENPVAVESNLSMLCQNSYQTRIRTTTS
jgi:hypothetical protein